MEVNPKKISAKNKTEDLKKECTINESHGETTVCYPV